MIRYKPLYEDAPKFKEGDLVVTDTGSIARVRWADPDYVGITILKPGEKIGGLGWGVQKGEKSFIHINKLKPFSDLPSELGEPPTELYL